jgi:hypothetical protein
MFLSGDRAGQGGEAAAHRRGLPRGHNFIDQGAEVALGETRITLDDLPAQCLAEGLDNLLAYSERDFCRALKRIAVGWKRKL